MSDWKEQAKRTLQNLEKDRQSLDGLKAQILQKEADMIALSELGYGRTAAISREPIPRMRTLMDEKRVLEAKLTALSAHVGQVDRALAALNEQERLVLTNFYCLKGWKKATVTQLEQKLRVAEATIYRINRRALREFAHRMGYVEA